MEINDQRKLLDLERRISSLEAFLADRLEKRSREQEIIMMADEARRNPEAWKKKNRRTP